LGSGILKIQLDGGPGSKDGGIVIVHGGKLAGMDLGIMND
jgi:hypothetical protein